MITVNPTYTEASRVYGDFIEKEAFEVDISPANLLGSIAGGYAATRTYQKLDDKRQAQENATRKIENNHYDNIQNILKDLKIIFTPINVVYSVNGQVFEIIKVNEMNPEMKERFLMKDGPYFKNLLISKMNMELQLAEQIFARRLLQPHLPGQFKEAAHFPSQWLEKISEETFDGQMEKMMEKTAEANFLSFAVSLDSLRPFTHDTHTLGLVEKVASIGEMFTPHLSEAFTQKDMKNQVKIGFLPDRVVYLLNGQLVEQVSIMHMNEEGYEAFKKRDEQFFLDFFLQESEKIQNSIVNDLSKQTVDAFSKQAEEEEEDEDLSELDNLDEDDDDDDDEDDEDDDEDDEVEKEAASLEEMMESDWKETLSIERESFELFYDNDIHPIVYDRVLDEVIGSEWHLLEMEVVLKEIEIHFNLDKPVADIVLDKIAMLQMIQSPENAVFTSAFTFEKFVRSANNKPTDLTHFEGGLEFEEILFAIDLAKAVVGEDVFIEFGNSVAPYVSEELYQDGIRHVSDQVFNEGNESEHAFWTDVNGYLSRKWRERDTTGMTGEEYERVAAQTERINALVESVLADHAEHIDTNNPFDSIRGILETPQLMNLADLEEGIKEIVTQNAARHVVGALFVEYKIKEAELSIMIAKEV